ncbi:hypothetical protein WDL1CHR_05677 [Variovorax sp. WDL1]|nr:hypothetical protein CHC06_07702 [Variovorax sp. B2]PNG47997.1 hypothetical protein CHC07_07166 [Variovorax sp. B4]VTV15250.1 hypothetical protein WDL1CHR_05677 [Variovorax sp. WDL1]
MIDCAPIGIARDDMPIWADACPIPGASAHIALDVVNVLSPPSGLVDGNRATWGIRGPCFVCRPCKYKIVDPIIHLAERFRGRSASPRERTAASWCGLTRIQCNSRCDHRHRNSSIGPDHVGIGAAADDVVCLPRCATSSSNASTQRRCLAGFQSGRVRPVRWVVAHIGIQVDIVLVANGIGLQEPAQARRVEARLVVIQPQIADELLAGVPEPRPRRRVRLAEEPSPPRRIRQSGSSSRTADSPCWPR